MGALLILTLKEEEDFLNTPLSRVELRVLSTRGNAPTRRLFWPASRQWWVDVRGSPCAPREPDQHGNPGAETMHGIFHVAHLFHLFLSLNC